MKPIDQLIIDDGNGDCLRAAVASVCELTSQDVPNFSECGFLNGVTEWAKSRGYTAIWMDIPDFTSLDRIYFGCVPEYFVAWGESPRLRADGKPKQHAIVVRRNGWGVKIAHDPHPSRDGLKSMVGFCFIVGAP